MAKDGGPELWEELAELASQEQDPEKLMALVAEINRLLETKDNPAKDGSANVNPEIAQLLREQKTGPSKETAQPNRTPNNLQ